MWTGTLSLVWVDTRFSSATGSLGHIVKGASWMGLGWRKAVPTLLPMVLPSKTAGLREKQKLKIRIFV